jgi:D-3-phosphoglycerate dehydrogenase
MPVAPDPPAFRVLLTDRAWPDADIERQILAEVGAELIEAPSHDETTLCRLAADVDAIAATWAPVTPNVLAAAPRCRVVARLGIGLDNIAVDAATARGILVTNVPDYCVGEAADHALALLLAAARNIAFFHFRTKQGEYQLSAGPPVRRLAGQTLGLFGLGKIARNLVPKARALGLRLIAHSLSGNHHGTGCEMVSLEALLHQSDFISLHAPLTQATRQAFGLAQFEQMRRTAWLINTSRGGLVEHEALWTALQRGLIAGAALDVFEPEPPDLSHPLFHDERVVVTPHAAFASVEALQELRRRACGQIVAVLRGERPENVVNPAVYDAASRPAG